MNKILIIGGAGYIGSHVVHELCDQGYNTIILDDLSTGQVENIDSRANFIKDSFSNNNILADILKDVKCVIHLAALKAAGESMLNPSIYMKNNIIDTFNLIELCIENNVENFIFSSSAAVYGSPEYLPIDEKHPLNPVNYYGFTKMVIEKQLLWYSDLKNINVACLRYFNAAGYDINGRIRGKEKKPENLLPIVMEVANKTRKSFNVFGNDYDTKDGTCLRDYIHVNDLATAHVKSIDALKDNNKLILNLATGNNYSVLDVINQAEIITNKNIKYNIVERRPGDPDKLYATSHQAKNILNWIPQYSDLNTILESMWKIYNI